MEIFPRWMYARLKYKCTITLLSILEARKTDDNVQRLMKSLNLEILKRNSVDIFIMYKELCKEQYSREIFNNLSIEPDEEKPETMQNASFIIQTGFNLFILY